LETPEQATAGAMLPGIGAGPSASQTKVLVASLIGSSIEWYDYLLYGTVAPLVFVKLFFPTSDAASGLLLTYITFALPFFVRPLGGIVFSHIGDKIGRKITLVFTLALMGSATVLIGCLPDYASIGVLAPIFLTTLRCIQGLGLGGEWGGALLLAVEYSNPDNRGFFGSVPMMGGSLGMLLGTAAVSAVSVLPEPSFLAWGWRIPFLLSTVLVFVGLWIRQGIEETPAFRQAQEARQIARVPLVETLQHHRREVLQAVGLKIVETASFYVFSAFAISYAIHYVGLNKRVALNAVTIAALLTTGTIPLMGMLADRVGRKPLYIAGTIAIMAFAFPYFWLVSLRSPLWFTVATSVALAVCWAPTTAVLGTLYSEIFSTDVRYTGVTLGYQLGAALAGGTAPLVATFLLEQFGHSWLPVAEYLVLVSGLSLCSIAAMRETRYSELGAVAPSGAQRGSAAIPALRTTN
jgi:metabolite-proton symporter